MLSLRDGDGRISNPNHGEMEKKKKGQREKEIFGFETKLCIPVYEYRKQIQGL